MACCCSRLSADSHAPAWLPPLPPRPSLQVPEAPVRPLGVWARGCAWMAEGCTGRVLGRSPAAQHAGTSAIRPPPPCVPCLPRSTAFFLARLAVWAARALMTAQQFDGGERGGGGSRGGGVISGGRERGGHHHRHRSPLRAVYALVMPPRGSVSEWVSLLSFPLHMFLVSIGYQVRARREHAAAAAAAVVACCSLIQAAARALCAHVDPPPAAPLACPPQSPHTTHPPHTHPPRRPPPPLPPAPPRSCCCVTTCGRAAWCCS